MIHLTSLGLGNSIQFLDCSPVIIGLELVFVNLCSNFRQDLLFLSFKENPDLLISTAYRNCSLDSLSQSECGGQEKNICNNFGARSIPSLYTTLVNAFLAVRLRVPRHEK